MEEKSGDTNSSAISLPSGGGAVQGIGETFQPNLFSGTGNFSIPIFTSAGRDEFSPELTLRYSTGKGNGIFGLGWELSLPRITRKTEKGLPRYRSDDTYVLSGAEDLVTRLREDGSGQIDQVVEAVGPSGAQRFFRRTRYLPRTESDHSLIEHIEELDSATQVAMGDSFWRVVTSNNVTSIYGRSKSTKVKDPGRSEHIFEWLLEETYDAKGNHILYRYVRDNIGLELGHLPSEQGRTYAQVYPCRILYGNVHDQLVAHDGSTFSAGVTASGTDEEDLFSTKNRNYVLELAFDYGQWDVPETTGQGFSYLPQNSNSETFDHTVPIREDAFSNFRPGFELRTLRLCRRALMIHHFPELGGATLVKSTDLTHRLSNGSKISLLTEATVTGYKSTSNNTYDCRSLPPVSFRYSEFRPERQRYQSVETQQGEMPAVSLNDRNTALIDLFGNGLQDIVQSTPLGFRYWRNLGDGQLDQPDLMTDSPAGLVLSDPGVSFGDMGGDGLTDLLVHNDPVRGYFELEHERIEDGRVVSGWQPEGFKHFDDQPSVSLSDPNLRMLDLTGDGLTDLLLSRGNEFIWYLGKGEDGFSSQPPVPKPSGLESVGFDNSAAMIRLADMSGDGLKDIVSVRNGSVEYWPNLGYGQFGVKRLMSGDTRVSGHFNHRRLFLADLDGSGTADLVYVDFNQVHFWFNQSGNGWSSQQTIDGTPIALDQTALTFTDFFATGTTSLLWSYDSGTLRESNYKVLDFSGGEKPYLLTEMRNNLGATTRVQYGTSSRHYLEDLKNNLFWSTPLPFPVHVVDKTETIDHINKIKKTTCYKYHHGYFNGVEREFRGFGRVDKIDSEEFGQFNQQDLHPDAEFTNGSSVYFSPAIETRTWFHTGASRKGADLTRQFETEFLAGVDLLTPEQRAQDTAVFDLPNHIIDAGGEQYYAQALRALRGSTLRTEVYAHDNLPKRNFPFVVVQQCYKVVNLQPGEGGRDAVYQSLLSQSLNYQYERKHNGLNLVDPRIGHQIVLANDDFGNPVQVTDITYRRRQAAYAEQDVDKVIVSIFAYSDAIDKPGIFRHSTKFSSSQLELTGLQRSADLAFRPDQVIAAIAAATEIDFSSISDSTVLQKRLLQKQVTLFWNDNLTAAATQGETGSRALPYESYVLALTPTMRQAVFGNGQLSYAMGSEGGYRRKTGDSWTTPGPGNWWIPSGITEYDSTCFYQPTVVLDAFNNAFTSKPDPYHLMPVETRDSLGNRQQALVDYRVLQYYLLRDPNGNHTEVAFNTLGLVAGSAVMGKAGRDSTQAIFGLDETALNTMRLQTEADSLASFRADLEETEIEELMTDPYAVTGMSNFSSRANAVLAHATSRAVYDFERYARDGEPAGICKIVREHHSVTADESLQIQFGYSDGFGREIQKKSQGDPDIGGSRQWIASGWTVFNNKGNPVQQFEPCFSSTPGYQPDQFCGVSSTIFYDPLGRVVCKLYADNSYEKVVFDCWQIRSWDQNDTVLLHPGSDPDVADYVAPFLSTQSGFTSWFDQRIADRNNLPSNADSSQQAAIGTIDHAGTFSSSHLDTQGQKFLSVTDNGVEKLTTRFQIDILGRPHRITDQRGNQVFHYQYDMAGRQIAIRSADAGLKRLFLAADEQPLQHRDERGTRVRTRFDSLRRPTAVLIKKLGELEFLAEERIYGEQKPNPEADNARGALWKHYDSAGLAINSAMDFKGNAIRVERQLLANPMTTEVRWPTDGAEQFLEVSARNLLEPANSVSETSYTLRTDFDALNRIVVIQLPDGTEQRLLYGVSGMLNQINILHPGEPANNYVNAIQYNARGQRTLIQYGNGVQTLYDYDPTTFRLSTLRSSQISRPGRELQNLRYHYDAVGNVTSIRDDAQPVIFHRNQETLPTSLFQYDPLYRLISSTGREHESMTACHYQHGSTKHSTFLKYPQPVANANALLNYIETYQYDKVGNILKIEHRNNLRTTIRNQTIGNDSNRIGTSTAGCNGETLNLNHDANGNLLGLSHLQGLEWDYRNQLVSAQLNQGANPDRVFFQYDALGQRIRKAEVRNNGNLVRERIYLGHYEIYRETLGTNVQVQRDTVHVMDEDNRVAMIERERDISNPVNIVGKTTRYQLSNHLGSSAIELDSNADLVSYEEYYPYGGTSYIAGRDQVAVSLKRYRYSGKERDDETGLYYYGARYYAPWLGRWISCDPAGNIDSNNLYLAMLANPISLRDKTGFATEPPNNFVEFASGKESGLARIKELGLEGGIEYGLALDPETNRYLVLMGDAKEVVVSDDLIGVAHTHTGADTGKMPSNADLDFVLHKRGRSQQIYGAYEDGWLSLTRENEAGVIRISENGKPDTFRALNPDFDPTDTSPLGKAGRWKSYTSLTAALQAVSATRGAASFAVISREFGKETLPLLERAKVGDKLKQGGKLGGAALGIVGSALGGYHMGEGFVDIAEGRTAEGLNKSVNSGVGLAVGLGGAKAVEAGVIVAGAGGGGLLLAGIAMGGSLWLAEESVSAALEGRDTPIDVAGDWWVDQFLEWTGHE